jgi:pimeloyl-ACP methyl ester carboxylesterase
MHVATPDGRRLDVLVTGAPDGDVVLAHHGTPGSARVLAVQSRAAAERGLRLVAYSRPGYGGSERSPGRTIASCAADAAAVLDAVGAGTCLVTGWSGGGPHALACAALLPDRVRAAATIAGVAPHDADGLDWTAGMGEENLEEFGLALEGEGPLLAYLEAAGAALRAVTGPELAGAFGDLVDDVDRAALAGEAADELAAQIREGLRPGVLGWLDDDLAFVRAWGFDLSAIEVPVTVWQGGHDRMVPQPHGPWLAGHVAGAQARFDDGHGHISLLTRDYGEVLDALIARSRPTPGPSSGR